MQRDAVTVPSVM